MSKSFVSRFGGLARVVDLETCDASWWARDPLSVGAEFKGPVDLAESVAHSGRLVEQARKAFATHDHYMLFLYGHTGVDPDTGYFARRDWRYEHGKRVAAWSPVAVPGTDRDPQRGPRYLSYQEVDNSLNSLAVIDRIQVKRALDEAELVRQVLDAYLWWQKPLEAHHTTMQHRFHEPSWYPSELPLRRRWAKELPGVDVVRSQEIARHFPSALAMAEAGVQDWMQVPGIGRTIATRVHRAIRKEG